MLRLAIKNSSYSMAGQLIVSVLGLLFAGMTIRYLGPGRAGFFILASSVLGWVHLAGGGAFHPPAVQKLAKLSLRNEKKSFYEIIRTVVSANILVGLPFAIAVVIAFPTLFSWSQLDSVYRHNALIVVVLGALGFLLNQYSSGLNAVYEGLQRFDIVALLKVLFGIFGNLARLISLIYFQDMASLAIFNLCIAFVRLSVDIILVNKLIGGGFLPGWSWDALKPLLSFGFWSWLSNTGNIIFINLTGVVLTKNLGTEALMYVSLPQAIVLQLGNLIISSSYFMFPAFASKGELIHEKIKNIEDRVRWFISVVSFVVFTGLFLIGSQLLTHLVSLDYSQLAKMPLLLFCIYGVIWTQEVFYVFSVMATGKNIHAGAIVNIVTSTVILIATAILIPAVGFIGLPLAFLFKLMGVIWMVIWSRRILNLNTSFKSNFSPLISPLLGSLSWIFFMYSFRFVYSDSFFIELLFLVIGAVIFGFTVIIIELLFFSKKDRLLTLLTALTIIIEPISQKSSNKLKSLIK